LNFYFASPRAETKAQTKPKGQSGKSAPFLLGKIFARRKNGALFETGGTVSAHNAVRCLGTRCESGTVAPL
jgi:hypothetical protein